MMPFAGGFLSVVQSRLVIHRYKPTNFQQDVVRHVCPANVQPRCESLSDPRNIPYGSPTSCRYSVHPVQLVDLAPDLYRPVPIDETYLMPLPNHVRELSKC